MTNARNENEAPTWFVVLFWLFVAIVLASIHLTVRDGWGWMSDTLDGEGASITLGYAYRVAATLGALLIIGVSGAVALIVVPPWTIEGIVWVLRDFHSNRARRKAGHD